MRKRYLPVLFCLNVFFAWSQESNQSPKIVRTEPNGVVVYEAPSVEQLQEQPAVIYKPAERVQTTFEDLSVNELEERLYYIDMKLQAQKENDNDPEEISLYEEQRKLTLQRIKTLKNPE